MNNDVSLNRRFFFRKSVASLLDCVCNGGNSKKDCSFIDGDKNEITAFWSDFTPEMIQFEAERLRISSENKEKIFEKIQQEMLGEKN